MQLIRRLYLYGMSGVTLAIFATGAQILLRAALDALGLDGSAAFGEGSTREQLSLAGALIGVGVPVWAIHWWLVSRSLRPGAAEADEERDSAVRSFYLSLVLAITLLLLALSVLDLVRPLFQLVLDAGSDWYGRPDLPGSIATLMVAGAAWTLHAWIRRGDMAAGPLGAGSMVWPRFYLYGVQLVGAFGLIGAIRSLVEVLADVLDQRPAFGYGAGVRAVASGELSVLLVLGGGFVLHAWYTGRLLRDPGWRGAGERSSSLRVAYFAILIVAAAATVITDAGHAARAVLLQVLGEPGGLAAYGQGARSLAGEVIVPLASAMPWLIAGLTARRMLLAESVATGDPERSRSIARLDLHLVALVGLAFGAAATGWLAGFALDVLLGGTRAVGSAWKIELAEILPLAVLGAGLWAWRWRPIVARRAADPPGEARSTIRRFALLLVLGVSILSSVGSLAFILYRLFGSLLGVVFGDSMVSALSTPVGALLLAGAVAVYHGLVIREDLRVREEVASAPLGAAEPAPTTVAAEAPAQPTPGPAQISLVLAAESPEALAAALERLRSALPEGARLREP